MYLDECGFAPSQPVSYTWVRAGARKRMAYENPQGRRENELAVLDGDSHVPSLHWVGYGGTFRGVHLARAFDELLDQPETGGQRADALLPATRIPRTQSHRARLPRDQAHAPA